MRPVSAATRARSIAPTSSGWLSLTHDFPAGRALAALRLRQRAWRRRRGAPGHDHLSRARPLRAQRGLGAFAALRLRRFDPSVCGRCDGAPEPRHRRRRAGRQVAAERDEHRPARPTLPPVLRAPGREPRAADHPLRRRTGRARRRPQRIRQPAAGARAARSRRARRHGALRVARPCARSRQAVCAARARVRAVRAADGRACARAAAARRRVGRACRSTARPMSRAR